MSIALTVLLATRNGERVLGHTLEGYCRVEQPSQPWKMVIVDNGSEDATPAILESFKNRLPLEILRMSRPGKSRALNYGLSGVEGRLVVITDDDAIPNSEFLNAWSKYLDAELDYQLFGGAIVPLFQVPPPKWLCKRKAQFDILFAARDLPQGPIAAEFIFGPNMAVRSQVFEAGFHFNEKIGPNGSDPYYAMGSETEFCRRVARSGAKAWFASAPRVQHIIRKDQLSRSYWARRFYRHGRGFAQQTLESGKSPPSYLQRPFIINQGWRVYNRMRMLSPFPSYRFDSFFAYHWRRGFCDGWRASLNFEQRGREDYLHPSPKERRFFDPLHPF